jgi:hypothetical protein
MLEVLIISLIIFLLGSLLHFTHGFLPKWKFVDIFSATNESTWEHVKILIVGSIITTFIYGLIFRSNWSILLTSIVGVITSSLLMITIFYSYSTILKKNILIIDILLFYICSFVYAYIMLMYRDFNIDSVYLIGVLIFVWILIFYIINKLTFSPPRNFLFKCPVSKRYGHKHGK